MAHNNKISVVAFKPTHWIDFTCEPVENREWDKNKLAILEKQRQQADFFKDEDTVENHLKIVNKLPYKFSYKFEDCNGKTSKLMIEDWEIGALYWNCLKTTQRDEEAAIGKVKQRYWDEFIKSEKHDITLILGTTWEHHVKKARNPFVIIGVVYPPADGIQNQLFGG